VASPDPNNVFHWYFIIFGLADPPYKGGYYMGKLEFPNDYPWKPPAIKMITETGRFETNARICLSISDYHPESWNPVWPVRSIIIGLISFFVTKDHTVGAIDRTNDERERIQKNSAKVIQEHKMYKELFATFKDNIGLGKAPEVASKMEESKAINQSLAVSPKQAKEPIVIQN